MVILSMLLLSTAGQANDAGDYPWKRNADAIVTAISNGVDLSQTGLAELLYEDELSALGELANCSSSPFRDMTKNYLATDWTCRGSDNPSGIVLQRTVEMRFRDDGSLFALAINPLKSNFAPTEAGAERTDWPSQEASAKEFAKAVSKGGDATLGGLIPLTPLQVGQLARMANSRWQIMTYMSEAEKEAARRALGPDATFWEKPKNGSEIVFSSKEKQGPKDKLVTVFFDDDDRAVGVHIEQSLLATTIIPGRN